MKFDPNYLKATAAQPQIASLKKQSYEAMRLNKGDRVLDIGCGPGIDTLALAGIVGTTGKVMGIDSDPCMVQEAVDLAKKKVVSGWTDHSIGEAVYLPFDNNFFDSCRSERVIQHLSPGDGQKAVHEAKRIVCPRGRIVFLETDWASVSVYSTNSIIERHLAILCAFSWKNGFAARSLPEMFHKGGLENIQVEVTSVHLSRIEIVHFVESLAQESVIDNPVSLQDMNEWLHSLEILEQNGTFFATVNMVLCRGTKPAHTLLNRAA